MNETIARMQAAMNRHDADGMAACFAPDYRSEQPAHPNRGFGGSQQVAANWSQLFTGVPDLRAEVIAHTVDGSTTWTEWDFRGHYPDGAVFASRGVNLMGLNDDGLIAWGRLYIEEVEQDGAAIEETVQQLSGTRH
jgi:hypothetical protein